MVLPRGQAVYENLLTFFIRMENFLQFLEEDYFTGYLEFKSGQAKGIVFYEDGEILTSYFEDPTTSERIVGQEAMSIIMKRSNSKDGVINLYKFNREIARILSSVTSKEALYKDLSTEFTDIEKIIAQLSKDSFSGYIEVRFSNQKERALIFLHAGKPIECVITLTNGTVRSGIGILNKIIEHAKNVGAAFDVYKAELQISKQKIKTLPPLNKAEVIEFLEKSFDIINSIFQSRLGAKSFERIYNETCIELADKYPFLDPFIAEIYFRDGHLRINTEIDLPILLEGINECLSQTFEKVTPSFKNLHTEISSRIEHLMGNDLKKIKGWKIDQKIPILFQGMD